MSSNASAVTVQRTLDAAARRVAWRGAIVGGAIGVTVAALLLLGIMPNADHSAAVLLGAVGLLVGALVAWAAVHGARTNIASLIEARAPECRNLLVTAAELIGKLAWDPQQIACESSSQVVTHVLDGAARLATSLDLAQLFPVRRAGWLCAAAVVIFGLTVARDSRPLREATRAIQTVVPPTTARIENITVTITPPAYVEQRAQTYTNPARVDALYGSRIRLRILSNAESLMVHTPKDSQPVAMLTAGEFVIDVRADVDGFVALTPRRRDGRAGAQRLIGVSVVPDAAPRVRIVTPGQDTYLRDARQRLELVVESEDDQGLASLRLRYTRVSGSGERFSFADGEVPLVLTRSSSRRWSARAIWRLDSLGLSPGDLLVYRAVTTDRRPGTIPQESDAYIAELRAPGGDAAAGFAIDPEQERYAVSQQMVVLKTERLIAQKSSRSSDALTEAAQELAAEQRKVRAEFVFMMGGELEDAPDPEASMTDLNEVAEAEAEDDILAGRLANQGRIALSRAVRLMSRAATLLTVADLSSALAAERSALAQIEQAFSRSRIILRALSEREQLDLSRRLIGALTEASSASRAASSAAADPRVVAIQGSLADLASIVAALRSAMERTALSPADRAPPQSFVERAGIVTALAQRVLRADPSSKPLQDVAVELTQAARALERRAASDAINRLDRSARRLADVLRQALPTTSGVNASLLERQLRGVTRDVMQSRRSPADARPGRPGPDRRTGRPASTSR